MSRKHTIAARFGEAADSYDQHAEVQRHAADQLLAQLSQALAEQPPLRALEFGCGTGYLSQRLTQRWPACDWLISDISADMVAHCRQRLGDSSMRFSVLDAEHAALDERFDLITSSLAFQWMEQPRETLARLFAQLNPGGQLRIATLGADSFAEWRASHTALDLPCGTPSYPGMQALAAMAPTAATATLSAETYRIDYRHGRDFLRALKGIGAGLPGCDYRGLSAGELRRVLRHFDAHGTQITYQLLYLSLEKPA